MMRLDKLLGETGNRTRSELKKMIRNGCATVNGAVVKSPDFKVKEGEDRVCFLGEEIHYEQFSYYLLHKPAGYLTAVHDRNYPVVMDLLPEDCGKNLAPVGRLDLDTEGLLLITNDGALAHHLLSPSHHVEKVYYAELDRQVPKEAVSLFQEGVDIGDEKPTLPAELTLLPPAKKEDGKSIYAAQLTIREGRFHQVKRMFETVGCQVIYLKRLSMGNLQLGDLEKGAWIKLTPEIAKNA